MKIKIEVLPLGWLARLGDMLMIPVMYLVSGTFREKPQQTHRWNNRKLSPSEVNALDPSAMVYCRGLDGTLVSHYGVRFHIPIFGGWKNYVVIRPTDAQEWYIGWSTGDARGVSCIKLLGPVRMLLGPKEVCFFGISAVDYQQITIQKVGSGKVGCGGSFAKIPLL